VKSSVRNVIVISLASFLIVGCAKKADSVNRNSTTVIDNESIKTVENKGVGQFNADLDNAQIGLKQRGYASWYGKELHGERVASGETFDMYAMTAAHRKLPFNTIVKVKNISNGKSVVVRINDRGPFDDKSRIIDLSYKAALELGITSVGSSEVELEVIGVSKKDKYSKVTTNNKKVYTKRKIYKPVVVKSNKINTVRVNEDILDDKSMDKINEIERNYSISYKPKKKRKTYKPSNKKGSIMVQIGSFTRHSSALKRLKSVQAANPEYKVIIKKAKIGGKIYHKVAIKGFSSRADAKDFIATDRYPGAFILR